MIPGIRDVQIPRRCGGYIVHAIEGSFRSRAAVAGKTRCVRAGQGGDGAGRIHLANAMISLSCNEEIVASMNTPTGLSLQGYLT